MQLLHNTQCRVTILHKKSMYPFFLQIDQTYRRVTSNGHIMKSQITLRSQESRLLEDNPTAENNTMGIKNYSATFCFLREN